MAVTNFIPTVWASRLLDHLDKTHVYAQPGVVNRDYEGEITDYGQTVKINQINNLTISTYTPNVSTITPQILSDASVSLVIDQGQSFSFYIDDVDRAQAKPDMMDAAMERAAYGLADTLDRYVAGLYAGVDAGNTIGNDTTPIVPTSSTAYDYLVDLSVILDEDNVPSTGRWVVVPGWFHGMLLKDSRFVSSGSAGADERLRNGLIGQAAGFTVLKSNNVPNTTGTKYKIIAGHSMAITLAVQINSVEAYRSHDRFADTVRGLMYYGAKLLHSTGIAVLTANKS